ncbi:MAG: TerC family protein [Cytophagaceae bacterium]|nr:TerC family protein [Cytophagaceae bacterium]MDW8457339.1 TerC family protein [Cytophagaceae bacterium]
MFENLFSVSSLISLLTLSVMEIILGIDNVIFVSIIISQIHKQNDKLYARRVWMIAGIIVRVLLLICLGWLVHNGNRVLFGFHVLEHYAGFSLRNCIMFAGGLFLLYKTVKEIHEKLDRPENVHTPSSRASALRSIIAQIILIDMVFSFDSIITAIGLASNVLIMIIAVCIAMVIMFFFANDIAKFIDRHPSLKMLALAFLLVIGFSLFFEGLEPIHESKIDKSYIYVAMGFSVIVEFLNIQAMARAQKYHIGKINQGTANEKADEPQK